MVMWVLITVLIVTGWGGVIGLSVEYVEDQCQERNERLLLEQREGPLQDC